MHQTYMNQERMVGYLQEVCISRTLIQFSLYSFIIFVQYFSVIFTSYFLLNLFQFSAPDWNPTAVVPIFLWIFLHCIFFYYHFIFLLLFSIIVHYFSFQFDHECTKFLLHIFVSGAEDYTISYMHANDCVLHLNILSHTYTHTFWYVDMQF